MYQPGSIYYQQFNTNNISGISTNTDSTPWGTLVKNGIDDFTSKVFITNVDTGRYTVSGTIPITYSFGNYINLTISGQVNSLLSKATLSLGVLDSSINTLPTTISVTGAINVTSINPGVTVSVTGVTSATLLNPVSVTGTVNANVISFSGIPVAAPGTSGAIITDSRYVNGVLVLSYDGYAQGGTINTIQLGANEPKIDNYYNFASLIIGGGSGLNQMGFIIGYSGATQTAYMDRNWKVTPAAGIPYTFLGYNSINAKYIDGVAITGGRIAANFVNFFLNNNNLTTQIVDNVGGGSITGVVQSNVISVNPGVQFNLSSSGLDSIHLETGVNVRQGLTEMGAVLAGVSSGNGSWIWYQGINNASQNRLSSNATSGIRTVVNYNLPA